MVSGGVSRRREGPSQRVGVCEGWFGQAKAASTQGSPAPLTPARRAVDNSEISVGRCAESRFEEWSPDEIEYRRQYDVDRKARIEVLVKDIETIPVAEMRRMVRVVAGADNVPTRQLLADVAYFADTAMCYPGIRPREGAIERYSPFLSSIVLREVVDKYSGHDR